MGAAPASSFADTTITRIPSAVPMPPPDVVRSAALSRHSPGLGSIASESPVRRHG